VKLLSVPKKSVVCVFSKKLRFQASLTLFCCAQRAKVRTTKSSP
jgi:hypothetical protein